MSKAAEAQPLFDAIAALCALNPEWARLDPSILREALHRSGGDLDGAAVHLFSGAPLIQIPMPPQEALPASGICFVTVPWQNNN